MNLSKQSIAEIIRFAIVGTIATLLHYLIYWILQRWINMNVAWTLGYALSFIANYFLTSYFTFREKASVKNGLGFGGAHLCNYLLQTVLLNFFVAIGFSKQWAPIPVYCVSIPVNFLLVRFVFKHERLKN